MNIIASDFKNGEVKILVTNKDDLWYLSTLIEQGDFLKGITERKIKVGADQTKVEKRTFLVTITVEKIEFSKTTAQLRVNGIISESLEDVPKGTYQTIELEEKSMLTLRKKTWLSYQKERLLEAAKNKYAPLLIVIFDRETALFALLKQYGYELILTLEGDIPKKGDAVQKESTFFAQIIEQIKVYIQRYTLEKVILASPAFWKDEIAKEIKEKNIREKIVTTSCGSVGTNAIEEVLRKEEIKTILLKEKVSKELFFVEELLKEIAISGKAAYGLKEVTQMTHEGAIEMILITDTFIQKHREQNTFLAIEELLTQAEALQAKIHIISSDHEGGKKLDGLGGIGAILRYKKY